MKLKHLVVKRVNSAYRLYVSEVELDNFGLLNVLALRPGKKPQNIAKIAHFNLNSIQV